MRNDGSEHQMIRKEMISGSNFPAHTRPHDGENNEKRTYQHFTKII